MKQSSAIGVFDSGVGGLSVLRELRVALPLESFIYVADSAHIPYGEKSRQYIEARARAIAGFMLQRGVKALVVACNTATAAAVAPLRSAFQVPIIGMEPGVKPAAQLSRSGVVGVLATPGTLASGKFAALLQRHAGAAQVIVQGCPGLVEQIERGDIDGLHTRALVQRYVEPLLERGADTLVLGCTHYPFVAKLIRDAAGPAVKLVETGAAVARELKRRLIAEHLLTAQPAPGVEDFWTSGDPRSVAPVVAMLWTRAVEVRRLPE
ncbi:MAG: glutamate racemase [Gammaproteobacteria bacterium]|nr:glutamate racemase [Gammaproteobacteria bacterium]